MATLLTALLQLPISPLAGPPRALLRPHARARVSLHAPLPAGKISRVLAAKCALGVRVDALGDVSDEGAVGLESRAKVRALGACAGRVGLLQEQPTRRSAPACRLAIIS